MSDENRESVLELIYHLAFLVVLCTFWWHAYERVVPNPLPTLTRDWVPEPVRQSGGGFYKYIKVIGSGDRPYLLNLNTDRGVVENVRAALMPGSYWKNITINSEGKVTRKELLKARDTGCLESAVIMRRTGIVMIGAMQVTDMDGEGFGNVELVSCKKKKKQD